MSRELLIASSLLSPLLAGAIACGPAGLQPTTGDLVPERALTANNLLATFEHDGAWLTSAVLDAPEGATRVGIMLEVNDAAPVRIEARAQDATRYEAATWTWAEGDLRVAKINLPAAAFGVVIRVAADDIDSVRALTWSAIVPEPEQLAELDGQVGLVDIGVTRRPLEIEGALPRSAWGARATQCSSLNATKNKISIHHTASPSTPAPDYESRLRGIQAYHMDTRGWCDVGYHFLITADGRKWEAREARFLGAHVGGQNTNNLGISLVGCFQDSGCNDWEPHQPPEAIVNAAADLVARNAAHYGISISSSTVMGHRDNPGQSTSCPGDNLHARLDDIRGGGGGNVEEPPPPADTGVVQGVIWDSSVTEDAGESLPLGARLDDAVITCDCGQSEGARSEDAYWSFDDLAPGSYTFTAAAPGFASSTRVVQVTSGSQIWASMGLSPIEQAVSLEVSVVDAETGAPLVNATVQATGLQPTQTDTNGLVQLELVAGEVTVVASSEDHEPATLVETFAAGDILRRVLRLERTLVEVEDPPAEPPVEPVEPGPAAEPELLTPQRIDATPACSCGSSGDGDASEPQFALLIGFALAALLRRRQRR